MKHTLVILTISAIAHGSISLNALHSPQMNRSSTAPQNHSVSANHKPTLLFAHGFSVPASLYSTILPLASRFRDLGIDIDILPLSQFGTLAKRSAQIRDTIQTKYAAHTCLLGLGQSIGGVDWRKALIDYPELSGSVRAVGSLASPHRGTDLAEVARDLRDTPVIRAFWRFLDLWSIVKNTKSEADRTIEEMSPRFMMELDNLWTSMEWERRHVHPTILSIGFQYEPEQEPKAAKRVFIWNPLLHQEIAKRAEKTGTPANDGIIPLSSTRWGQYLGTLIGSHHEEAFPIPKDDHNSPTLFDFAFRKMITKLVQAAHTRFPEECH